MVEMVGGHAGLYQHVVYVDLHGVSQAFGKHLVNQTLIGRTRVLEAELHDFVAVCSFVGDEGRFSRSSGCISI